MVSPVLAVTLRYAAVPVVFTVIGAAVGVYWPAMERWRAHVLHLAAGVCSRSSLSSCSPRFSAARWSGTWSSDSRSASPRCSSSTAYWIEFAAMMTGDDGGDTSGARETPDPGASAGLPLSLVVAVGIDFVLDGVLLGVGFAAGARIGILLALAEAAEQLSVGLALAGELRVSRMRGTRILLLVSALGSLVFVSAVVGATMLAGLQGGAMEIVLSFGAAALLYLVTEELLREAHEQRETPLATMMFFIGFLAFLVIGMTLD